MCLCTRDTPPWRPYHSNTCALHYDFAVHASYDPGEILDGEMEKRRRGGNKSAPKVMEQMPPRPLSLFRSLAVAARAIQVADKNSLCVNVLVLVMDGRDIVAQAGRVADPVILVFRSPPPSVVPEDADCLVLEVCYLSGGGGEGSPLCKFWGLDHFC